MKNIFHVIAVAFVLLALVTAAFDTGPQTTAPPGDVAAIAHASPAAAAVPAFNGFDANNGARARI